MLVQKAEDDMKPGKIRGTRLDALVKHASRILLDKLEVETRRIYFEALKKVKDKKE